jgi:hypothetical protein
MIVIQQMCARIGIVTGKGLAGVILDDYSKRKPSLKEKVEKLTLDGASFLSGDIYQSVMLLPIKMTPCEGTKKVLQENFSRQGKPKTD